MSDALTRFLAFHFAGGDALFTGLALVAAGSATSALVRRRAGLRRRIVRLMAFVGAAVVALAAVPLPEWFYAIGGGLLIAWWFADSRREPEIASETTPEEASHRTPPARSSRRRRLVAAALLVAWCALAAGWEIAFRAQPILPGESFPRLVVVGDSISAGLGDSRERTWPKRVADELEIAVFDLSRPGATARSAATLAERIDSDAALVLVEIGGNDLLGGRSSAEFAADLERLLQTLSRPGRGLVMLELPLPPLYNGFGRRQRELARKHGAALVPRREFAKVLFAEGMTVDGLHLSQRGHAAMAGMIRARLGPRLPAPESEERGWRTGKHRWRGPDGR